MAEESTTVQSASEWRAEFEHLGEPLVIHRLSRMEPREKREAAILWLGEQRRAKEQARYDERRKGRGRLRRLANLLGIGIASVSMVAGLAVVWL